MVGNVNHAHFRLLWSLAPLLIGSLLLTAAAAGPSVLPGDVGTTREVQEVSIPGIGALTHFTNWIGDGAQITVLALALTLVLAVCRRFAAAGLMLAATLTRSANALLKVIAASPRPTPNLVHVSERASGQGFPSGHVMSAVLVYGAIAYLAHDQIRQVYVRRLVQALAVIMVLATGFGRVYVGAHWPSDVLGSYLWGTCLLLLLMGLYRRMAWARRNRGTDSGVSRSGAIRSDGV